jgi:hypothetical protein
MSLPAADRALVDATKVRDYLLSAEHPVGRFKARFFQHLGYSRDDWPRLRDDLLVLAHENSAVPGQPTPYGQKYEVRGTLTAR